MNLSELEPKTTEDLVEILREIEQSDVPIPANIMRDDALYRVLTALAANQGYLLASGVLELMPDGYGFLRHNGRRRGQTDVYVAQ